MGAYPEGEHLNKNYDTWVGEKATVWATVVETDPLVVEDTYGSGKSIRLSITDTSLQPTLGERVVVYGIVKPNHTLSVLNAFTIPATNFLYMYTVSFLSGLWVFARTVRGWRVDTRAWSLEPRQHMLSWSELLGRANAIVGRTRSEDA
ncbi:hypothetical protein [Haloferax gibbonsii]|uniref:Uncharacterized protein n=1 Tax=Haloferax gibbonsii TaxID=35746 RepID=A0A0K1IZD0_HALGI|nr:hypothetical protein [Haloferax gibbonsii]AKU09821.1 hypothetical protein ABY42_18550 [Haloferax gibbonsii]